MQLVPHACLSALPTSLADVGWIKCCLVLSGTTSRTAKVQRLYHPTRGPVNKILTALKNP